MIIWYVINGEITVLGNLVTSYPFPWAIWPTSGQHNSLLYPYFPLQGETANKFAMSGKLVSADEVRGSLTLAGQLDYETRNLHNIKVCAMVRNSKLTKHIS